MRRDHAPGEEGEWRDPSAGGQPGRGRRRPRGWL